MKQSLNLLHNLSTYQSLCNLWFFAGNGKEDMQLSTDTNSACVTLTDWENEWLTDWPRDWLTDWLTKRLTDWLTDWLTKRLTDWLTDWPTNLGGLTDRSTNWKTNKLVDSYWHFYQEREYLKAKKDLHNLWQKQKLEWDIHMSLLSSFLWHQSLWLFFSWLPKTI